MLILLPPSESKTARSRGRVLDHGRLSFPELTRTRTEVAAALAKVSGHPDAAQTLGVSQHLAADIHRNTVLATAPAVPVARLYSGVLYDALDYATLSADGRRRANRSLVVVSALYGAVRPTDLVAPYRLSMGVNLPGLGPLAGVWRPELAAVLPRAAGAGIVVDCRSSTYAAAWAPSGALADRWVQVSVPGATHMAKHTRGLVARHLCESPVRARRPEHLHDALAHGFETSLTRPLRPGRPWVLEVTAR